MNVAEISFPGYLTPCTHLVDALSHLDLNDTKSAEQSLKAGREALQKTRQESYGDGHDSEWVDWRVFMIFEKEVESRLQVQDDRE